jgi:hypothetical protein
MNGGGESYSGVIPAKQLNKSGRPPAEVVEGRPVDLNGKIVTIDPYFSIAEPWPPAAAASSSSEGTG